MLKNMRGMVWVALIVFGAVLQPHDSDAKLTGSHELQVCGDCHWNIDLSYASALFDQTPNCLSGCHTQQLVESDASQLFNYSTGAGDGNSHAWGVPYTNVSAGASSPATIQQTGYVPGVLGCPSCHYAHYLLPGASEPLLKIDNSADQLCLDCHRVRNVDTASPPPAGKQASHPVGKPLPATAAYRIAPRNTYDNISGSKLKLISGNVSCSTCHGVHFADSNPWTAATMGALSSAPGGDGVLLRRYNDSELCKDCHTYMGHSAGQQTCRNCHDPHLGDGGKNFRLIYSNLSTPAYGIVTTVFDNLTTQLAGRSDGKRGVCDACHIIIGASKYFAGWSSTHEGQTPSITSATISTTNCFGCHEHAIGTDEVWTSFGAGGAAACSGCHGFPPRENTFKGPSGFAAYSSSAAGWYNYTATLSGDWVNESTSPHKRHAMDYPYDKGSGYPDTTGSCYACHAVQDHPDTATSNGNFQNVEFGLYSVTAGQYGNYDEITTNRTCTNVYCHSKPNADYTVAGPNTPVNWMMGQGSLVGCDDCHDAVPTTNKHEMHTDGVNYSFACRNCHSETVLGNTVIKDERSGFHVNRKKDVFFTATAVGGSYSNNSAKECSNTYCHGNFADSQGLNATPSFDEVGGSAPCGSCHALPPTGPTDTHVKHVSTYKFECAYCHDDSMAFDVISTIEIPATHVDYEDTVTFANDLEGRTNIDGTYDKPSGNCDNLYCHSWGTTPLSANFFFNITANWTGAVGCNSCHGEYPAVLGGWTSAMPDYPDESVLTQGGNFKQNSHREHVVDNGIDCVTCHELTLIDNSTIKFTNGTSHHVDGNYDIKINSAYDAGGAVYVYDANGGTCDNVKCHGGNIVTWGDNNITCSSCHNTTGPDVDNFVFSNFSVTAALINSTQWTTTGHGRINTETYPSNSNPADDNDGAQLQCDDCHKSLVAHGDPTNPFRLYSSDSDQLCNICHGPGAGGTAVNKGIFNHSSTTTDALVVPDGGRYQFELKCVDCHDPHGDDNAFMIHSTLPQVSDQPAYAPSDQYGTPNTGITWRNVDFPNNAPIYLASTSVSLAANQTKICNICHTRTNNWPTDTLTRYQDTGGTEAHFVGQQCTASCHKHTVAFEGVSCEGCHGMPPAAGLMLNDFNGSYVVSPTGEGAHVKHGEIYVSAPRCNVCHDKSIGGMDPGGIENTTIDIDFKGDGGMGSYTTGTYDGINARGNPSYNGSFTTGGSYACTNVKCHGAALVDGKGFDITPIWTNASTGDCGACHGAKKSAGTPFTNASAYPASGAHQKHAGFASGEYDILCKTCHDATLSTATTVVDSVHVNALSKVQLDVTSNKVDSTGGYTDEVVGSGYMNCDNTYCHSMGNITTSGSFGSSPPNDADLRWDESRFCNSCHGTTATYSGYTEAMPDYANGTPKANTHKMHVVDRNIACNVCHGATTADNTSIASTAIHVDKNYQVDVSLAYDDEGTPNDFSYNVGSKTCTETDCHGGNFANWSATAGAIICEDCHGSTTADKDDWDFSNWSGTVAKIKFSEWTSTGHGNSGGANLACDNCHDASKGHSDGATYFRLLNTDDPEVLCLSCHGSGGELTGSFGTITGIQGHTYDNLSTAGYTGGANDWSAGWSTFTPKCIDCHDPHGDNNTSMTHSFINVSGSTDPTGIPQGPARTVDFPSNTIGAYVTDLGGLEQGVCQVCHIQANFYNKTTNTGHNIGQKCTNCHDHSVGFKPSGCDICHSFPPPPGPPGWAEAVGVDEGLHDPHANTNRADDGIPDTAGYTCDTCHDPTGSNGESGGGAHPPNTTSANMANMTTVYGDWSDGGTTGETSVSDDTCSNVTCHGGRAYKRKWAKPGDCDDCHGGRAFDTYTQIITGSHNKHTNNGAGNYNFVCTECHVDNLNNYTTHYDSVVDIPTISYTRGATFEPFTSNEFGDCSDVYCHGNFTGGGTAGDGTADVPTWGGAALACTDCHMGRANVATMPEHHPKHADTYSFECARCHDATVSIASDITITTPANHVNATKQVQFDNSDVDNSGGNMNGSRQCLNIYCHSNGADLTAPYAAELSNYTADWDDDMATKFPTSGEECSYCHGSKGAYTGITSAMPYNTGKADSHIPHVISGGFACNQCHNVTTTDGRTINGAAGRAVHIDGVYTVDLLDGGLYVYDIAGGSCSGTGGNCHSASAPQWGDSSTAKCLDCHSAAEETFKPLSTTGNGSNGVSLAQYTSTGHGRTSGTYAVSGTTGAGFYFGDGTGCENCHDLGAGHTTKEPLNPYRIVGVFANNLNGLCLTCHVGQQNHDYTTTESAATHGRADWPMAPKCVDCHDPHGDGNLYMIRSAINAPVGAGPGGSDVYGTPLDQDVSAVSFDNTAGKATNSYAQASPNEGEGICEVCHSKLVAVPVNWYNQDSESNKAGTNHETRTNACTACHKHNTMGFQGEAGPSPGGVACTASCHSLENIMNDNSTYHHAMRNVSSEYTNTTSPVDDDVQKRCLMCHVDHDIFNDGDTVERKAFNLRQSMADTGPSAIGVNTDFYPALSNQSPAIAAKYGNTAPVEGTFGNGICIECHSASLVKNTTGRRYDGGSTNARGLDPFIFYSSSHNYQIISSMNNFTDGTSFRANCTKCHRSRNINKPSAQTSTQKFGLHDSNSQSLLNVSTAVTNPKIEELCYRCHSDEVYATYDEYSSVEMSSTAKMIKTAIVAKKSGHPIDNVDMETRHKPDEYDFIVPNSWNPAASRHVECTDCHNTHGGNSRIIRQIGSPTGNVVAGSQKGAWGVSLDYSLTVDGETPEFTKIPEVTKQYELCIKCHSAFAYDTTPPGAPSGLPDPAVPTLGVWYDNFDTSIPQADISKHMNPNIYAFHPIYSEGLNQPLAAGQVNPNWPAKQPVKYYNPFKGITTTKDVEGLGWTFVPPYDQYSLLACSDCHQADNTGQALGKLKPEAEPTGVGTWTTAPTLLNIGTVNGVTASTDQASANFTVDVTIGIPPGNPPLELWGVAYGQSAGSSAKNRQGSMTLYDGVGGSIAGVLSAFSDSTIVRAEVKFDTALLTDWNVWTALESSYTLEYTTDTVAVVTDVDYVGLEAVYVAAGKIRGPHGSLEKWILMDLDNTVQFDTSLPPDGTMETPNAALTADWQMKVFCWNCHRSDVYSVTASSPAADQGRFQHNDGNMSQPLGGAETNVWGIVCMNCHGGGAKGEIHGSWQGATTDPAWYGGGAASVIALSRPRGVRLLNGAQMTFDPATNTCYTPAQDTAYGAGCQNHKDGVSYGGGYNYDYTTW